jgi:cytochrome c peroxidase
VVLSLTCSTCHAAPTASGIEPGRPNASLQLGAAILAAEGIANAPPSVDAIAAWGSGRVDVTTATGTEPARIPDLRPVGFLTYLQQDATVHALDAAVLAIRIETLIITSNQTTIRPPRVVALALAAYVRSLAAVLPSIDAATAASPQGADLFAARCVGCHVPPALTGDPVALSSIGTDPTLGLSADRGTGMYRVPSLHGVATRGPLLHDGTLPSVDAMFDPARLAAGFPAVLHDAAPIAGHPFGLDLGPADRQALLAFLNAL